LQNSINSNNVELGNHNLEVKHITILVKIASKVFCKMVKHTEDNSIPKEITAFTKSFFIKLPKEDFTYMPRTNNATKSKVYQISTTLNKGGEHKANGKEPGLKRLKKEFSDKSLKMGLFHIKKRTPATKAFPNKIKLKDGAAIYPDFCHCSHKCPFLHQLCKSRKHFTYWKNIG
jgi:hypothetical protein